MAFRKLYHGSAGFDENGKLISASLPPLADYNSGHMLVVGDYDHILHDYLKRDFVLGVKVNSVKATGYPHVWNEQKAIPANTTAIDPQAGFGTAAAPSYRPTTLSDTYNRNNWQQAFCRAYATGIRYDFFTREMEREYGTFEDLTAKDYDDMFVDFTRKTCDDFWNGTTALNSTAAFTYAGILSQITDTTPITAGTKIADALRTKIASLAARLDYSNFPDVICMNPITYDLLCNEEATRNLYNRDIQAEIVPGVDVPGILTAAGKLPIVLTPFIKPVTDTTTNKTTHKIVCLNTSMIDRIWMFNDGPRVFEIANPEQPYANDSLLTDKFVLDFANYILHGAQTGAHFMLTLEQ